MLEHLAIEDFAIIKRSEIQFQPGFNVLSGETGAGKSILIDALSLLMGARADASMIRQGATKADIHAQFNAIPDALQKQLEAQELVDEEAPTRALLRRTLREKAGKSFINSAPVTSTTLRELAPFLINIHGQNSNQELLKSSEQRARIDHYGKHQALLKAVATHYATWQKCVKDWEKWQADKAASQEKLSLLAYQLEEFTQCAPQAGEFETLSKEQQLLASSEEIMRQGGELNALLRESDASLSGALHDAYRQIQTLVKLHGDFKDAASLLEQAAIYVDEASDALQQTLQPISYDPERLAEIDERMQALHALARKHHLTPDELPEFWQSLSAEFAQLSAQHESNDQLLAALDKAQADYQASAAKLSKARHAASKKMAAEVQQWVRQLGMEHAVFSVAIAPLATPSASGSDEVTFMLCANPGQALQPLAKVASGGELSRISLAIEVASLDDNAVPNTLIFDEIDAGIGGEVANTVGKLLAKLAQVRQVLCITHLPQVAVWAAHHYQIIKTSDSRSTQTAVKLLDETQRVNEIARMMGNADSKTSKQYARDMLKQAQQTL